MYHSLQLTIFISFARAHNFGAATRGPCRRTETQATPQKHKGSELAFAALWLCTLPRVLRRTQLTSLPSVRMLGSPRNHQPRPGCRAR